MVTPWTAGVVGHGVASPSPVRTRPEACAEHGHPPVTYHPQMNRTWCLCGQRVKHGHAIPDGPHVACCGGVLTEEVQ